MRRIGRLASGSRIVLDCRDHAQWHIYFYGSHEEATTRLVRELLRPGDVVLDVGANAGYYSLLASDLGCEAHAFEPQPALTAMLRESIALNRANVSVVEAACGAEPGEATLFSSLDPQFSGLATLRTDAAMAHDRTTVPVVTIDDYCAEHDLEPGLLKIDVEGFELPVLQGARRVLDRFRPNVVCEVKDDAAAELLTSLGYDARPLEDTENIHFAPALRRT